MNEPFASITFGTALGRMAIAWGERGVVRVLLPDEDAGRQKRWLARGAPSGPHPVPPRAASAGLAAADRPGSEAAHEGAGPPPEIRAAIDGIRALLSGQAVDLGFIRLDMRGIADFDRRVYEAARAVPPGRVTTYGEIAIRLGDAALARAVGRALARNPFAPVVPCHRVLGAGGRAGGFSAPGGLTTKLELLRIERARLSDQPGLFDAG